MIKIRGTHSLNYGRISFLSLCLCVFVVEAVLSSTQAVGATPTTSPATLPEMTAAAQTQPSIPSGAELNANGWFAPIEPKAKPPELPKEVTKAFIIPIREEISTKTFDAMKRKAKLCRAQGAELVIFDMDTWGGSAHAGLDIARLIKTEFPGIRTVCFARTRAVSAGALIAVAANEIVMTPTGVLGDCAPIVMGGKLEGVEREKMETVLRAEFRESAMLNGYNSALAESMVSWHLEVWLVRNKETSELRYVLSSDYRGNVDAPPGVTTAPTTSAAKWELLRVVKPERMLLTMQSAEALQFGFAKDIVESPLNDPFGPLLKKYNVTTPATVMEDLWSETMVGFLTSPTMLAILTFVGIICLYIEFQHPGLVAPAVVGILCFAIIFGARYLSGMALWWEIVVFAAGVILILVEIFVIPGFGVPGIIGIICCVVGLLAILVDNPPGKLPIPETQMDWSDFTNNFLALALGFITAVVAAFFISRHLPKVPLANRLVLAPVKAVPDAAVAKDSPAMAINVGDEGVTTTLMHPVGKVRFANQLFEATADGAVIEAGAKVKVLRKEGNHLIVERTS